MGIAPYQAVFLHGFLGSGADWKPLFSELKAPSGRDIAPDYLQEQLLSPTHSPLSEWGRLFLSWCENRKLPMKKTILVGYSMGGRLALHAMRASEFSFAKIILISAHPGLSQDDDETREQRRIHDQNWAAELEKGRWEDVIKRWNSLPVFAGSAAEPCRLQEEAHRHLHAASLRRWSLSFQQDFQQDLMAYPEKFHYVVGERDSKYCALWNQLALTSNRLRGKIIEGSGHRVLFDQPRLLAEEIERVIEALPSFE